MEWNGTIMDKGGVKWKYGAYGVRKAAENIQSLGAVGGTFVLGR